LNSNQKFEEVLKDNKDRIYRICCAYVRDTDEREDLFQEIMINIWKNLGKFEGRSLVSTWIYRIAVNTSLMHVKSAGRRGSMFTSLDEHSFNAPEPDPSEREEKIRTGKAVEQLYSSINKLKEIDRLIISMVLDELSYKEIAEITGMTVTNIGVKITRIKKELAQMMEPPSVE